MPQDSRDLAVQDRTSTQERASSQERAGSQERASSNVLELSVGELSGALKRTIEDRFGFVRVRGEISNYRGQHSSGHAYFCLKDESARIDAVVWKTAFARLKTKPQEGLEVIATGRVTTFPGKSTYQIVIEAIEPAGIGALMAILEARRKALAAAGLFDEQRKRPLPFLPKTIGVVTSPTGAVIRDILHRIEDRFPRNVLVWPVRVQGETAAAEIAAAIAGFDALRPGGAIPRPDVLIVARGGGSLEDLWSFNEEIVVQAAAACSIPLISAVGHETDWTLIDHVADLRAPTPSGAAEKAVPVRTELLAQHADFARRHLAAMLRVFERRRGDLRALARALPDAESIGLIPRQRLDRATTHMRTALAAARDRRNLDLARLAHRLANQAPRTKLAQRSHQLASIGQRMRFCLQTTREARTRSLRHQGQRLTSLASALRRDRNRAFDALRFAGNALTQVWTEGLQARHDRLATVDERLAVALRRDGEVRRQSLTHRSHRLASSASVLRRDRQRVAETHVRAAASLARAWSASLEVRWSRLERLERLLESLGYRQVLARGFALVRDNAGRPVRSIGDVPPAATLDIELADGHIEAAVGGRRKPRPAKTPRTAKTEQGSLF